MLYAFYMEAGEAKCKLGNNLLDVTSLLDLKAEVLKKQESLNFAKLNPTNESVKRRPFKLKGSIVKESKKHVPCNLPNADGETELAFEKSRLALAAKSKLYEDIVCEKRNLRNDESENYLVNFHKKLIEGDETFRTLARNSETRSLNPNDISFFSGKNEEKKNVQKPVLRSEETSSEETDSVHYQHVQFNEIRDHGVGYFAFSKDEKKRKEQMDMLNELHNQTNVKRRCHNEALQKRKSSLEVRLAKICSRRNIDKNVISGYTSELDSNETTASENDCISHNLSSIPLPESEEVKKVASQVRPWDIGKVSITTYPKTKKWEKVGQDEWIERKRSERLQEFQPPKEYS